MAGVLSGLDDLLGTLSRMEASLSEQRLQEAAQAGADVLAERAREFAPVASGTLREDIHTRAEVHGFQATGTVEVLDSAKGGQIHYAIFVEYGTENAPAEPFMRPAFDTGKQEALLAINATLRINL